MPASSLIVGVDLAPIKPIPRTITFQSDITTDKCRAAIRQHLKSWKADTVLHDGAPNVGTAWVQDAFSQAELALQAFKLATEFLIEGGTFVTKVFRSKDYNSLLWVFGQLFNKVEATKPPSSRNVSAEIFVVCRGFKAPKYIDPKFLDPRSVFAELSDPTPNNEAKVFNPEKKKRKREGYEEGNYTQFKEVPATDFIQTTDPIAMLGSLNRLTFDQPSYGDVALAALEKLPETSMEVRHCCLDLKVLGRKEFRVLLRWRLAAREKFGLSSKEKPRQEIVGEEVAEVGSMDEELQLQKDLQKLNEKETSRKRRERRRENERKQKEIVRMQLHMMPPTELGMEQKGPNGEDSMFALAAVNKVGVIEKVARGKMAVQMQPDEQFTQDKNQEEENDEEEDELEKELDAMYSEYQERKSESDAKYRAKRSRKEYDDGDWAGFPEGKTSSGEEFQGGEGSDTSEEDGNGGFSRPRSQNISSHVESSKILTQRASHFFDQDIFKDIGSIESDVGEDSDKDTNSLGCSMDPRTVGIERGCRTEVLAAEKKPDNPQKTQSSQAPATEGIPYLTDKNIVKTGDKAMNQDIYRGGSITSFEMVQDIRTSEWDKQEESRAHGRLGKET